MPIAPTEKSRKPTRSVDPSKAEAVRRGLDELRRRLLDTTKRNNLINFRHGRSSLRVVDVDPEAIYAELIPGREIPFTYVPEPGKEEYPPELSEKPSAKYFAERIGWATTFDLVNGHGQTNNLRALLYQDDLEATLRKIATTTKTATEESGINLLHLVFGFLEWRESDDSSKVRYAPLLVVPVELITPRSKDSNRSFRLKYNAEDLTTNLSLVEMMRKDFGLEIPELEEGDTPEQYFQRFDDILRRKQDWKICRHISLALLSFAKLLMYRDLDSDKWPANALLHHERLLELFAGAEVNEQSSATEFDIDEEELQRGIPPLIYDADSSQHSALIDAARGKNLVIEGPPGTGKSQTITNLIAEFLASGKRVLFVAEKMAALDVVKQRLDKAGLGDFCLELHSHKANKVEVLKSIEKRVQATFPAPVVLAQKQSLLNGKRDDLKKYVTLLNTPFGAIEKSPFELIWQRDKLSMEVPDALRSIKAISLPDAHTWDFQALHVRKDMVLNYGAHLQRLLDAGGSVNTKASPWARLSNIELSAADQEYLVEILAAMSSAYEQRLALIDDIEESLSLSLTELAYNHPSSDERSWFRSLTSLPNGKQDDTEDRLYALLPSFTSADNSYCIDGFIKSVREYRDVLASNGTASLLDSNIPEEFIKHDRRLEELGLKDYSIASLHHLAHSFTDAKAHVERAKRAVTEISEALGVPSASLTLRHIGDLVSAKQLLVNAPLHLAHLRDPAFAKDGLNHILERGKQAASELQAEKGALKEEEDQLRAEEDTLALSFMFDDKTSARDLLSMAHIFENTPWYARFGKPYRAVSAAYRAMCVVHTKQSRIQKANSLKALAQFCSKRSNFQSKNEIFRAECDGFSANAEYRAWLGDKFAGLATVWDDLITIARWEEAIYSKLPEHREYASTVRSAILSLPATRLKSVLGGLDGDTPEFRDLEQALNLLADVHSQVTNLEFEYQDADVDNFLDGVRRIVEVASDLLRTIEPLQFNDGRNKDQLKEFFEEVAKTRSLRDALNTDDKVKSILGEHFKGVNTELQPIDNTLALVRDITRVRIKSHLPPVIHRWLLSDDYLERIVWLQEWASAYLASDLAVSTAQQALAAMGWEESPPVTNLESTSSLAAALSEIQKCINSGDLLSTWIDAKRAEEQLIDAGLKPLVELCAEGAIAIEDLAKSLDYLFCNSLVRRLLSVHPDLLRLSGASQEETRSRFAFLDSEVIQLNRMEIASRASKTHVPTGMRGSSVNDLTEKQLLIHEMSKQMRHIAIRKLMARAGNAIQALKPCFMMSPMSVAQFLAPGHLSFDLVVMDEASQLRPEDALGAIARGDQLVIVGDPKQLPPTSFFQRTLEDESEDDEKSVVAEGESILDNALGCYQPVRRLRWHYRSQHESLIRFSNQEFYDRDLVIFPSAYESHPDLGVRWVPVENGIYENRRNPIEAERVVDAIIQHIKERRHESLGVVTMNFDQRELIEELLDKRLKNDPVSNAWIEESGDGSLDGLFIKNLENVQGDERDVIFISVTYGLDSLGNYFQRLSSVSSKSGHRRLNVLITRAKKRTVVFSSLDPDLIRDEPSTPWGVRALKGYMKFAKSGITARPEISPGAEPANEHEAAVGYVLKEHGYTVVPQVGVCGYFIDLAVKHPKKPGAFLLGVEFDGKSYHSGRSARDRDRLRQMALERQGWQIHRIWSTDWFKNRNAEIDRLMKRVRALEMQ